MLTGILFLDRFKNIGDAWLSLLLIGIAIVLIFFALFDHNITRKAIIATWVLAP